MSTNVAEVNPSPQVVPLSKKELILGGCSNFAIVIIGFIFEIWIDTSIGFDHTTIKNESDLSNFSEYIASTRTAEKIQLGVIIFAYPLFIFYYISMVRVLKICFVEYHTCRAMYSVSYVIYLVFLYLSCGVGVLWQAFYWTINDDINNTILPSADMILLLGYRFQILLLSFAIYFAAIMSVAWFIPFICALSIDLKYNNNIKEFIFPSCCSKAIMKISIILLTILTLIGAYLSVYSWKYYGFWSLTGGSQIFQMFTIFSGAVAAIWLIWFAMSNNYQKFNDRVQFQQFI
eukprot:368486_1